MLESDGFGKHLSICQCQVWRFGGKPSILRLALKPQKNWQSSWIFAWQNMNTTQHLFKLIVRLQIALYTVFDRTVAVAGCSHCCCLGTANIIINGLPICTCTRMLQLLLLWLMFINSKCHQQTVNSTCLEILKLLLLLFRSSKCHRQTANIHFRHCCCL